MKITAAGMTHVGMKRSHNEDNLLMVEEEDLYLVADGMGGHASGEVASKIAVETIADFFNKTAKDADLTWPFKMEKDRKYEENRLVTSVKLANLKIYETASANAKLKGMGTTIVTVVFAGGQLFFGHVGDSRAYRVRDGKIDQMTEDHSLLNDYKKMAKLTPEEERNFPHKNIIVRALGMKETVQVDVMQDIPQPEDIFLLCSDGLSGEVEDPQLLELIMANSANLEKACEALIEQACANGGKDNVTAILVRCDAKE